METSGPSNMETVLLYLTATAFDRGVKCVCVTFHEECVGGTGFKRERDGQ